MMSILPENQDGTITGIVIPSRVSTNIDHFLRHQAKSYNVVDVATVNGSSTFYFYFKVTAGKEIHMWEFNIESTQGSADIYLYEGGTVTVNGTALTPRNHNRYGTDSLGMVFYTGSTVTVDGTQLQRMMITAGKQSGGNQASDETILKDNTVYLVKYVNNSASNDKIEFHFNFLDIK